MEFSKKITVVSWSVAILLTLLAVIFPTMGVSIEGIVAALPYSWGEVAVANGFYLWKAKNENRSKYALRYMDKLAKEYDTETALRIAEIVLKD